MVRKMILMILGYAGMALLVGLGLLGLAGYSAYSASHGGNMPEAAALSSAKGVVTGGREMTLERKRRRGGKTTTKYFELDLKSEAGGEPLKLRVDYGIPRQQIEATIDETVTASYDPNDNNMVYEMSNAKGLLVSKTEMAKIMQAKADQDKSQFASASMWILAIALTLFGVGGLVWRRKLLAQGGA